jgi:hypothetical protein
VAEDDCFHPHSDDPWETETAWFSFNVPERRMGGWLYNQVLAVQGICNGGAWLWDDSPAGALYERRHDGLPFPDRGDLRDAHLPNGNSIRAIEPLTRYELRYADDDFEAELTFTATMAPHSHPLGVAPFWKGRHFDQPGRIQGDIRLNKERIAVDCLSNRDRSWGPRPRGSSGRVVRRPSGVGYVFGNAAPGEGFLAYTIPLDDGTDELSAGYLLSGGVYAPLVSGRRRVEFDPRTAWIRAIELDAVDALGRPLVAAGELMSRYGERGPNGTGLFVWRWNGLEGWGEDQSFCPGAVWRALGPPVVSEESR